MKRTRTRLAWTIIAAVLLMSGAASAGKDRPQIGIPEPSDGQFCVYVGHGDLEETVCVPMP